MIKQVCRWEAGAARSRLFFCSLSLILWSQNVIALNFLIPSGVHAILGIFFGFFFVDFFCVVFVFCYVAQLKNINDI